MPFQYTEIDAWRALALSRLSKL